MENYSIVYFVFKIPFLFGKLGKKLYIPNCANNMLSLLPDFILPQLCEVHSRKKNMLQNWFKNSENPSVTVARQAILLW